MSCHPGFQLTSSKRNVGLSNLQLKDFIRDGVREGRKGMESWVDTYTPEVTSRDASTMLSPHPNGLFMVKKRGEERARKIFGSNSVTSTVL